MVGRDGQDNQDEIQKLFDAAKVNGKDDAVKVNSEDLFLVQVKTNKLSLWICP